MSVLDDIQIKYKPLPKQKLFHESGKIGKYKYRALAGGVGSGKTIAGAWEAFFQSTIYPRNFGLIGRQTYPELRDSTWKEFINLPIIVQGKETNFTFGNGYKRIRLFCYFIDWSAGRYFYYE